MQSTFIGPWQEYDTTLVCGNSSPYGVKCLDLLLQSQAGNEDAKYGGMHSIFISSWQESYVTLVGENRVPHGVKFSGVFF